MTRPYHQFAWSNMSNILAVLFTYDRYELLKESLETMFRNPGLPFRLSVVDNGSIFENKGLDGERQLDLLLDYYKQGLIENLIFNSRNLGCNHAVNQLMAQAKLTSQNPKITNPDFIFQTNDDMIYEDNWLSISHDTLLTLESPEKVTIVSPFHCKHLNGAISHGMHTIKTVTYNGITYEIKEHVSGNTWFMRGSTWLNFFDWWPVHHPTEGGDWEKLFKNKSMGFKCAITPTELAHHAPDAQGRGRFNRLGHW